MAERISKLTRRKIATVLDMIWSGDLDDVGMLSGIYDLEAMPSTDSRFGDAARDIWQHRSNNDDWEYGWIFYDERFGLSNGPDETLLRFICHSLHPDVRSDLAGVEELVETLNQILAPDGYHLIEVDSISGHPIFDYSFAGSIASSPLRVSLEKIPARVDLDIASEYLDRIRQSVEKDPSLAIGSSKELLESVLKQLLDNSQVAYSNSDDLPSLYKKVAKSLKVDTDSVPSSTKGSEAAHKVLRSMTTIVQGLAELRSEIGTGHGRNKKSNAEPRHAILAFNSTRTLVEFLALTAEHRAKQVDKAQQD